jgi:hypothetical protein
MVKTILSQIDLRKIVQELRPFFTAELMNSMKIAKALAWGCRDECIIHPNGISFFDCTWILVI